MNNLIFWIYIASIADSAKNMFVSIAITIAIVFLTIALVYVLSQLDDIVKKKVFLHI